MGIAIIRGGEAVEIFPGLAFVDGGDVQRPSNWLEFALPAEQTAAGIRTITEPSAAPEGKIVRITGLTVTKGKPVRTFVVEDAPPPPPVPVPYSVTNYQARAVMRQVPMPDGRSLFNTVDTALRAAVDATKDLPEFDPQRVEADVSWQAWEQANDYKRDGDLVGLLASRFGLEKAQADDLFRRAETISA